MSKCVVHMQKMKMSAMGGIQSHNQREHKSKKNNEIDYSKSEENFDCVLSENINYQQAIKDRISSLNLKKAVRKDAVVYCSFIVSSDKDFFVSLGKREHFRRERNNSIGFLGEEITPFEYCDKNYREDCIRAGAERFFQKSTDFFSERYGAENIINATVHMDEATPHMHIGIVPITSDGRLSAKDIFNPLELKQLQTDFAEEVGKKFKLERGKEGSDVKHLDEISFKIKKREEQLEKLDEKVGEMEFKESELTYSCNDLKKQAESLSSTVSELKTDKSTLESQILNLGRILEQIRQELSEALENFKKALSSNRIKQEKALEYIKSKDLTEDFEKYLNKPIEKAQDENTLSFAKWKEIVEKHNPFGSSHSKSNDISRDDDLER